MQLYWMVSSFAPSALRRRTTLRRRVEAEVADEVICSKNEHIKSDKLRIFTADIITNLN